MEPQISLSQRFASTSEATLANEAFLLDKTVGLLTQEEYNAALEAVKSRGADSIDTSEDSKKGPTQSKESSGNCAAGVKRKSKVMLSFLGEEDEEEEPAAAVGCVREVDNKRGTLEKRGGEESRGRSAMGKDPSVSTSFLPDAAREAAEAALRQEAKVEWLKLQETIKAEALNVVYSYWDGAGHRREVTITKGYSIGKFCEAARADLVKEFPELRALSASSLIYVKEDLIIPHHYTFYELISTGARGKSGPLFSFDVHDDVRLVMDARAEKDESHPGKILDARWYQRNKHIFPYNRWEVFDPKVERDKYTIK